MLLLFNQGLQFKITKEGTGAIPQTGNTIKTQYTGWLNDFDSSTKFDSSRDRGKPFTFRVGKFINLTRILVWHQLCVQ